MFSWRWAAQIAPYSVCILIGVDDFCLENLTVQVRSAYFTEKDAHIFPLKLHNVQTVVLIIGDNANIRDIKIAVNSVQKNALLAECYSILSHKNDLLVNELVKVSAVLHMEKDDFNHLIHTNVLACFMGFIGCENGWVRLDKADINSVLRKGCLARLKIVAGCGQNKFADIFKRLQPRFPDKDIQWLILYLVSGIQTDLQEIEQVFSGFYKSFSSDAQILFGVGVEGFPELSNSASCFLLY